MTREEAIVRWKPIVQAVLSVENDLDDEWLPRLKDAKGKSSKEQIRLVDEYLTAIATEIVSRTSDDELKEMKR